GYTCTLSWRLSLLSHGAYCYVTPSAYATYLPFPNDQLQARETGAKRPHGHATSAMPKHGLDRRFYIVKNSAKYTLIGSGDNCSTRSGRAAIWVSFSGDTRACVFASSIALAIVPATALICSESAVSNSAIIAQMITACARLEIAACSIARASTSQLCAWSSTVCRKALARSSVRSGMSPVPSYRLAAFFELAIYTFKLN